MIDKPEFQFVDTNIFIYAYDRSSTDKQRKAKELVLNLWENQNGCISVQVLQEFFVNLIRKKVSFDAAREVVENYFVWEVIVNDCGVMTEAFQIQKRYATSFWDALVLAAANRARTTILLSEDLNHHQVYGSVKVVNPLLP